MTITRCNTCGGEMQETMNFCGLCGSKAEHTIFYNHKTWNR